MKADLTDESSIMINLIKIWTTSADSLSADGVHGEITSDPVVTGRPLR